MEAGRVWSPVVSTEASLSQAQHILPAFWESQLWPCPTLGLLPGEIETLHKSHGGQGDCPASWSLAP